MTIETIILYIITLSILVGVFIGEGGLETTFQEAGPLLGAKIERHIETGSGFTRASQSATDPIGWAPKAGTRVEGIHTRNE